MTTVRRLTGTIAPGLVVLVLSSAVSAQGPIGGFSANLPVPASPAFAALDLSPDTVARPATPNELASSLLNGVDRSGVLQQGVALDVAPFMTWAGHRVTRDAYIRSPVLRFLSRAQVSLATAKAASDDERAMRVALGTTFTLFDIGDPRADAALARCIAAANRAALAAAPPVPPPPDDLTPEAAEAFDRQIARIEAAREQDFRNPCRESARAWLWNRSAAVVGIAPTWISPTGSIKALGLDGLSAWASVAYGFEQLPKLRSTTQLAGFVAHRGRGNDAASARAAETSVGARLRVGGGATALALEIVRARASRDGAVDVGWSMTFAGERKLTDDLWLTLSVGGRSRPGESGSQTFVLNSLSWRYAEK